MWIIIVFAATLFEYTRLNFVNFSINYLSISFTNLIAK